MTGITSQIETTLGDHARDFDIDAIAQDIAATYGGDLTNIDAIPNDEYWDIVGRHDLTTI